MKQTAVEWLYEHILLTPLDIRSINKCLEQAKEMEREQIVKAYTDTLEFTPENISKGEQYYNENYNL